MRVLHIADLHINLSGPRAEECARVVDWIADNAAMTKPDAIVIAGDVFDRRSTPQERTFLARFLLKISEAARTFVIDGNHDCKEDLGLFRKEHGWMTSVDVILGPSVFNCAGIGLAFLPWPSLGSLAHPGSADSISMRRETARVALIDVVRGFSVYKTDLIGPNKPSLLVAHVAVRGASMDSGQPVTGGEEIALTVDELLDSGAAGVALGHVHLQQWMKTLDSRPVVYAGAPFRTTFGESGGYKGGLVWDWNGKSWDVKPWATPARRMVLLERNLTAPGFELSDMADQQTRLVAEEQTADADIRVRITFLADNREAMRAAMAPEIEFLRGTAHSVMVEEIPAAVSRTRCVEIAKARTPMEKLRTWAEAVGAEVPEGAEAKLQELETEAQS